MRVVIVFKNGFKLNINCREFALEKCLGTPTGYSIKGIEDNQPVYIDWKDVSCVYRDLKGEEEP